MPINIEMPKLSDTMTEGTLIKWHKQVGDQVEIGDVIAEVETDKATMEMEAFDEGTLLEIRVGEGSKAPIGAVLAVLGQPGEAAAAEPPPAPVPVPAVAAVSLPAAAEEEAAPPVTEEPPLPVASTIERVKASPLARRIAGELGIDLRFLHGTGPGGRVLRADVEAAAGRGGSPVPSDQPGISAAPPAPGAPTPAPVPAALTSPPATPAAAAAALAATAREKATGATAARPAPAAMRPLAGDADQRFELTTIRRIIAERLLTAKTTIPHFYLHLEVDAAPLFALRKQVNEQAAVTHGNNYTLNDFILKATINAAQAVPEINASFDGDSIVRFANIGLAVAIAIDDGLVTPVIKQAQTKSLLQISREVKDMAARAKERKLRPDEFDGGTLTVSNLGAWGIEFFDAIINPPQAAILAVGAAGEKPVVKDGQVVPGLRMNLGLSVDHRVVDGAVASRFLAELKKLIEQPALMLI